MKEIDSDTVAREEQIEGEGEGERERERGINVSTKARERILSRDRDIRVETLSALTIAASN